jgi:3-oxoacyl-[acyl-carrier protein] reductase
MLSFDSFYVGQIAEITHDITLEDIERFAALTGDYNRLHVDPEFAATTSFKKPVAHGMLGASFISTIIGTKLPGDGALWFSQTLEFHLPVRIGDRLSIRAEILRIDPREQILELNTEIFNQHRQKVTTGISKVKLTSSTQTTLISKRLDSNLADRKDDVSAKARVVLVIGGSGGIGRAVCDELAKAGHAVAVHCRASIENAKAIANRIRESGKEASAFQADIREKVEVQDLVESVHRDLGGIRAVVNCATAPIAAADFRDLHWDQFQGHLNSSLKGSFHLAQAILPEMIERGYGRWVDISTLYVNSPAPKLSPYIAAKSALEGLNRSLALEYSPKGINFNLVSPSMTETDQIADVPEKVRLLTAARTPAKRLCMPTDVAAAVVYLLSPGADFVTGQNLRINGGQLML